MTSSNTDAISRNPNHRTWLTSYPPSVPCYIDEHQYQSVCEVFEEKFQQYADKPAVTCMDVTLTYKEIDRYSRAVAAWLQSKHLPRGARVAVMMPNIPQYLVCVPAILRAGYVLVNVNPQYTPRELEHQLHDSGAEALFILENFAHTYEQIHASAKIKHVIVASMGDLLGVVKGQVVNTMVRKVKKMVPHWHIPNAVSFKQVLLKGHLLPLRKAQPKADDLAILQYTGGTTGVSKGAMLLHRNVLAFMAQAESWLVPTLTKPTPVENPVFLTPLPLYHIFALGSALMAMKIGASSLLIANPRDMDGFVRTMRRYPFHIMAGVNTLFNALAGHKDIHKVDFSDCRVFIAGAMAMQKPVAEKWQKLTGKRVLEGYGLSEVTGSATCNPYNLDSFNSTIGLPFPSTEIALRDDNEQPVAVGEAGEICIRGPQVMAGYWQRDDETAKVMTADGFFKTGDIGVMDDRGFFRIVDRKKDMILVSGFNVYPNEIEEVAASHPDVLEAAAIGLPDEHSGEVVKLFIVKRNPDLTIEAVKHHCEQYLTGYKRPRKIEFIDQLPKSPVGKILRRELRPK